MSEFSKQVTSLLTPTMKSLGFKKVGTFDRSALSDSATYERERSIVKVILQLHPYDYPDVGMRLQISSDSQILMDRLYPTEDGDVEALIKNICSDIDSGGIPLS